MKKMCRSESKEISIIELEDVLGKKYKVTKRIPELNVSETRVFRSKKLALRHFEKWLNNL